MVLEQQQNLGFNSAVKRAQDRFRMAPARRDKRAPLGDTRPTIISVQKLTPNRRPSGT